MPNIGFKHSEETKIRMSLAQKGRKHSEETKQKISLSHRGIKFSKEHCHNLSLSLRGRTTSWKGRHHTEETKQKIRLKRLGRKNSEETNRKSGLRWKGKNNPRWNGGKRIHQAGYILIKALDHPTKHHDNYILEHRFVMEKYLGRLLKRNEIVHHINEDVSDNRIKNLMLFPNVTAHLNYHRQTK